MLVVSAKDNRCCSKPKVALDRLPAHPLHPALMSTPPPEHAPAVNIARAIRGALLQAETKRWMVPTVTQSFCLNTKPVQVSRGKRKGQIDAGSSPATGGSSAPSSPGAEAAGKLHLGLLHAAAAEADLAALLEVFEVREAEVKEHGHATSEIPSSELDALLQSIGISCSSEELEALCAQLQHVAGHVGTALPQAHRFLLYVDCIPPPHPLSTDITILSCSRNSRSYR